MQGGFVLNRVRALSARRRLGTCLARRLGPIVPLLALCGAFLSAALFAAPATAATCTWVNTAGGNWDASANWSCDGLPAVPGSADDAYILADGTYTVTLNVDASVASLMVGGSTGLQTLLVLNHRLFVDGTCTVFDTGLLDLAGTGSLAFDGGGTVTFSALRVAAGGGIDYGVQDMTVKTLTLDQFSTISGSGTITVTEQMHWQWGGTLTGTGTIVIADTASALVDGGIANCTLDYYNLTNNGSLVWSGCDLLVNNKSTFLNNGTFTIHQDGAYDLTQTTGDASLINATTGVVVKDGLAAVSVDHSFHNQGALTVQAGSLTMQGPFGNYDGEVDVQGGTLTLKGGGASSSAGPMTVSGATAKLVFNTTGFSVDGNLSGTNVSFEPIAGEVVDVNGDFNMSGTVEKYSLGTVNFNGTVAGAGDTVVVHDGQFDFKALEVSIPHLTANGGNLLGSGTVAVTDSLVSNGHAVTGVAGSGFAVVVAAGATASIDNTLTLADATLINEGTLTWKANINDYAGGNIVNNGVFDATTDATITAYGGGGTFGNAGTFRKSAGAGASTILCPFTNAGTIAIESGTLAFWQGTSATTLQNSSTGAIRGTGTLEVSKIPANFTTAGAVTPATAGTAGILTIRGRLPQTSTSSLDIDIGGTTAGTEHDKVAVVFTGTVGTGVMTLAGALNVNLINGYDPPIGASFTIVTYSSRSGTAFGSVNFPTLSPGKAFRVTYNATSIVLSVVSTDPNVSVAPASPFNYGSVAIGTPVAQTFTISNTGVAGIANALAISEISVSGNADFTLNLAGGASPCGTPPKNVAAGANCTVAVTLNPSSVGARSATLTVVSNDPDTPSAATTLNGTGYLPTYVLSVTRTGAGTGTVTSDVGSINCGATCSGSFDSGTVVTLSAAATTGSQFIGWSGAGCSGSGNCTVTMSGARSVSALFALPELFDQQTFSGTSTPAGWTVVDGAGTAKVWVFNNPAGRPNLTGGSGGFAIADSYWAGNYNMNTELRSPTYDMSNQTTLMLEFKTDFSYYALGGLAEKADVDVSVNGGSTWTNVWRKTADYRGPKTETVDLTAIAAGHADVVVRFHYYDARYEYWWQVDDYKLYPIINRLTVSKGGTGTGSVSSNLGGISCGETCSAVYGLGDGVTLSATPDPGYLFRGWSGGGCSGTGDCTVTMNGPLTVTATFMNPGVFLDESFSSGQPSGWSVVDTAGTGAVWRFDDPGGRTNLTGGTGGFAIADSYKAGNVNMDTSLVSPLIDLSGVSGARLEFRTDFFYYTGGGTEKADVDVSVNGGTTWTNVWQKTANYRGPASESVDIAALAAGSASVRVRFHYYGARYDNWWQVDDVRLVVNTTQPTATDTPTDTPTDTATGTASSSPSDTPAATDTPTASPTPTHFLGGSILYYANSNPVAGVTVEGSTSLGGPPVVTVQSDGSGTYVMTGVPAGSWALEPGRTEPTPWPQANIFRGVSSMDATWIQEHAAGIRAFSSNQKLAADVTGNGSISSLDATRIQEWRVGTITRFAVSTNCNSDWAFVPVPGPQGNPTPIVPKPGPTPCVPGAITYPSLGSGASGQDFQAVLFGDVTGNWSPLPTPTPGGGSTAMEAIEGDKRRTRDVVSCASF